MRKGALSGFPYDFDAIVASVTLESTVRLRLALFSQVRDVSWNIRLETSDEHHSE